MAKQKKEPTDTVRVSKAVARKARMAAAAKDMSLPDYLTERLAVVVDNDLKDLLGDLARPARKPRVRKDA